MKKVSVISILVVLVFPAFSQTDARYLYGDPANIKLLTMPGGNAVQVSEPQTDVLPANKPQTDSMEIAEQKIEDYKVEEQEIKEKKIEKTEQKKYKKTSKIQEKQIDVEEKKEQQFEPQSIEPQKYETKTYSNPKAKFPHGLQLGVGVSATSGLNAFIGYNNKNFDSFWWKRFGLRIDFATYSPIKNRLNRSINNTIGDDGIKIYDGLRIENVGINAKHYGALVDFYPFGNTWFLGGLRISGGYMTGNLELNADIHGTKESGKIEFELGDRRYSYDGDEMRATANANWKYRGPYAGAGFDLGLFYGFKIYFDAGVVFANNNAKIDLNIPLDGLNDITSGTPEAVTGDVKTEYEKAKAKALAEAQDELDKVDYYPIVKLGFMYRF